MAEHAFRMPDVGEGIAEAEIVEWFVAPEDEVEVDQPLGEVMTDKATIEVPSPVVGRVLRLGASVGEVVAVGAELVLFDVEGTVAAEAVSHDDRPPAPAVESAPARAGSGQRVLASPAVRRRALEAGVDLSTVRGSGPAGRVEHSDLDAPAVDGDVREVPVIGLRRRIAEQLSLAATRIPHITYVEEVDVTELELLRASLNDDRPPGAPKLTILPFIVRAVARSVVEQPQLNARFDDDRNVLHEHRSVHAGIATQTPKGLVVPVVRHAERLDLGACAAEIARLSEAARSGTATADELRGSTITISSLGALGGIASTPIINRPEVAIIGVNRIQVRPSWDGFSFLPRQMMNLSSSFDHRIVDGWDAARFVQRIRAQLEQPALLFVGGPTWSS